MQQSKMLLPASRAAGQQEGGAVCAKPPDVFSTMKNAVTAMFTQRTRDLTKNNKLEEQANKLQQEVERIQDIITDLNTHHAAVDALLEEGDSRTKTHSATLKEVHTAITQASEDQELCSKLQKNTERISQLVQCFVSEVCTLHTGTNGDPKLQILMERGRAMTCGRSFQEFRLMSVEVRRRAVLALDWADEVRRTTILTPSGTFFERCQEWSEQGLWRSHTELSVACQQLSHMRELDEGLQQSFQAQMERLANGAFCGVINPMKMMHIFSISQSQEYHGESVDCNSNSCARPQSGDERCSVRNVLYFPALPANESDISFVDIIKQQTVTEPISREGNETDKISFTDSATCATTPTFPLRTAGELFFICTQRMEVMKELLKTARGTCMNLDIAWRCDAEKPYSSHCSLTSPAQQSQGAVDLRTALDDWCQQVLSLQLSRKELDTRDVTSLTLATHVRSLTLSVKSLEKGNVEDGARQITLEGDVSCRFGECLLLRRDMQNHTLQLLCERKNVSDTNEKTRQGETELKVLAEKAASARTVELAEASALTRRTLEEEALLADTQMKLTAQLAEEKKKQIRLEQGRQLHNELNQTIRNNFTSAAQQSSAPPDTKEVEPGLAVHDEETVNIPSFLVVPSEQHASLHTRMSSLLEISSTSSAVGDVLLPPSPDGRRAALSLLAQQFPDLMTEGTATVVEKGLQLWCSHRNFTEKPVEEERRDAFPSWETWITKVGSLNVPSDVVRNILHCMVSSDEAYRREEAAHDAFAAVTEREIMMFSAEVG